MPFKKGNPNHWKKLGHKHPLLGKPCSEDIKIKISIKQRGRIHSPSTLFKKGLIPWNKGKKSPLSSEINKRRWSNPEFRNQVGLKISKSNKGKTPWNRGKEYEQVKGNKNPNWKGGISFEKYSPEFNRWLKESILKRDGHECKFDRDDSEYRSTHKGRLSIHHIDYDKKNCNPENLITLCIRHNSIVNKNREHWKGYFESRMGDYNETPINSN